MKKSLDGSRVKVHYLKEPEYTMVLMSSYNTLRRVSAYKKRVWVNKGSYAIVEATINYPELVFNIFQYIDAVDPHNGSQVFLIALEDTWKMNQ